MNSTQTIVAALQQALRGKSIDNDILTPAVAHAIASPDLHALGCEMLKALLEHQQSTLRTERALILVQLGRPANA